MNKIHITPDDSSFFVNEDETILTASLRNKINHLHACGGTGRCSTCRVEIVEGLDNCYPIEEKESTLATKLSLPPNIRLACQTKLKGPVKARRLLLNDKDVLSANQLDPRNVGPVGSGRNLALMFVDIKGFTPMSEQLPSYDVMYILNNHFEDMGSIVREHGGEINNFVGDAFLAAFGLDGNSDSVFRCIETGLDILKKADGRKREIKESYSVDFDVRIGIHYGEAIVGMLGNSGNQRLSIIGQSVNLASRVEAANKEAETRLLVSEEAYEEVKDRVVVEDFVRVKLRGASKRSTLYEITEVKGPTTASKDTNILYESGLRWHRTISSEELVVGDRKVVTVNEKEVLLIRTERSVASISNSCPHMNLPLEMGHISDAETIRCPFHDSEFCLKTGEILHWVEGSPDWMPDEAQTLVAQIKQKPLAFFPCMEKNGYLWVSADE